MARSTMTSKGQVTIPKPIRDALGLRPGDRVRFTHDLDGRVVLERDTIDVGVLAGALKGATTRALSVAQIRAARGRVAIEEAD